MAKEFRQHCWNAEVAESWRKLLALALDEDLGTRGDVTTLAVVGAEAGGRAAIVARQAGVVAGMPAVAMTLQAIEPALRFAASAEDGQTVHAGQRLALLEGSARAILSAERLVLNVLGRLSGIATATRRFVQAVGGTATRIYDTRKTTPGWRLLEKYAVRCGGGFNHRTGLFDAVLIKDNHLALWSRAGEPRGPSLAEVVRTARHYTACHLQMPGGDETIVEVEVDELEQLAEVLSAGPDVVLLDNMTPEQLRQAVAMRDTIAPAVELEASGGIDLGNVRAIAETGVDRISIGALTHSAPALDVSLDWL